MFDESIRAIVSGEERRCAAVLRHPKARFVRGNKPFGFDRALVDA